MQGRLQSDLETNRNNFMFETEAQEIDVAAVSCLLESALAQHKGYRQTLLGKSMKFFCQVCPALVVVVMFDAWHLNRY